MLALTSDITYLYKTEKYFRNKTLGTKTTKKNQKRNRLMKAKKKKQKEMNVVDIVNRYKAPRVFTLL